MIPVGHHRTLTGAKAAACRAQVMQGGSLQRKVYHVEHSSTAG